MLVLKEKKSCVSAGFEPGTSSCIKSRGPELTNCYCTHYALKIVIYPYGKMLLTNISVTETAMELKQKPECS